VFGVNFFKVSTLNASHFLDCKYSNTSV